MTPDEAYNLYRDFTLQFARYTSEHPEGENLVPPLPEGVQDYRFWGNEALAEFLTFVVKKATK